jgi:uncharacterized protein (UPF0332 family)
MSYQLPEGISKALAKAQDAIESAEYTLNGGFDTAAISRAYYACYYCMLALLSTKQITTKSHQGTHTKFNELFIKTELFPRSASKVVTLLFDYRQKADYDIYIDVSEEEAKELVIKATEFLQLTKNYFDHLTADNTSES